MSSVSTPPASHTTLARLPEQALLKFSGRYEDWLSFQDDFQSRIDQRRGLSGTEKLKYLRSCLSGEPERIVKQFETTNEEYQSSWSLLKQMFEDKARERHVSGILNITAMQRESARDLSDVLNTLELHAAALKSLGEDTFSTMMMCIALTKIDSATRKLWKLSLKEGELPTHAQLTAFLRRIIISSDEPSTSYKGDSSNRHCKSRSRSHHQNNGRAPKQVRSFVTTATNDCNLCKEKHQLFHCQEFRKLSPKEKYQAATRASICINCLRSGHNIKQCTSSFTCKTCHKKYHTWLHFTDGSSSTSEGSGATQPQIPPQPSRTHSLVANIPSKDLLVTAKINVQSVSGNMISCRVLLDTCSNTNFMTERLAALLGLDKTSLSIPIGAMNKTRTVTNHLVTARVRSRIYNFVRTLNFLTIDDIAGLVPDERIPREALSLPRNIELADPEFDRPATIDMLISSGTTLSTLCMGQIILSPPYGPNLYLQKTRLGWIIGGAIPTDNLSNYKRQCHTTTIENITQRFWKIEITTKRRISPEEVCCEDHFLRTINHDNDGSYVVALRFNGKKDQLGESRATAMKRLM